MQQNPTLGLQVTIKMKVCLEINFTFLSFISYKSSHLFKGSWESSPLFKGSWESRTPSIVGCRLAQLVRTSFESPIISLVPLSSCCSRSLLRPAAALAHSPRWPNLVVRQAACSPTTEPRSTGGTGRESHSPSHRWLASLGRDLKSAFFFKGTGNRNNERRSRQSDAAGALQSCLLVQSC